MGVRHGAGSLLSVLLLTIVALAACGSNQQPTVSPAPAVLEGDIRTHDPGLIRQDNTYYVFSTGDEHGLNQGSIQIRASSDLARWELIGTVFETTPGWISEELGSTPPNLWAPDISYFNGKYHLYYAGSRFGSNNSVIGLATNVTLDPASPDYQWLDQGLAIRSRSSNGMRSIRPWPSMPTAGSGWHSARSGAGSKCTASSRAPASLRRKMRGCTRSHRVVAARSKLLLVSTGTATIICLSRSICVAGASIAAIRLWSDALPASPAHTATAVESRWIRAAVILFLLGTIAIAALAASLSILMGTSIDWCITRMIRRKTACHSSRFAIWPGPAMAGRCFVSRNMLESAPWCALCAQMS